MRGSKQAEEDSFGLIGYGAIGPILAVMILNMLTPNKSIPVSLSRPCGGRIGYGARFGAFCHIIERQHDSPLAFIGFAFGSAANFTKFEKGNLPEY